MQVENFGPPINLMLSIPVTIIEGVLEDALLKARQDLTLIRHYYKYARKSRSWGTRS